MENHGPISQSGAANNMNQNIIYIRLLFTLLCLSILSLIISIVFRVSVFFFPH